MTFPTTESEILARLSDIDAQILEMTTNWETLVDYRIGDRAVNKTVALAALRKERDSLLDRLESLPSEAINEYDDPDL